MSGPVNRAEWLVLGIERGWCSEVHCATHDGLPTTVSEDAEWEEGGDPCCAVVRVDGLYDHGVLIGDGQ